MMLLMRFADPGVDTLISNPLAWVLSALCGKNENSARIDNLPREIFSSAKDQLTGQAVAIKKIMKPFSTPVLSKRTYRELKLLKHLRHENVMFIAIWRGQVLMMIDYLAI